MKILLVDDSPTIRAATTQMLEKMGHAVTTADNGELALAAYEHERPDLVLMDVTMPVMDGYAAAQQIRTRYPEDWVPIIFLSGADNEQHLERGIRAGGDDYLIKPASYVVLHAKIHAMQRIDDMRRRLLKVSAELGTPNRALERMSRQDGLTELANRRYFDTFLADEMVRARRSKQELCLALCDVDFFKAYNDHSATRPETSACGRSRRRCRRRVAGPPIWRPATEEKSSRWCCPKRTSPARPRWAKACAPPYPVAGLAQHLAAGSHVTLSVGVAGMLPGMEVDPERLIAAADRRCTRRRRNSGATG